MITTANINIDPEICKAIDRLIYSNKPKSVYVLLKADLWRSELLEYIRTYNPTLADKCKDKGLYYLYCLAERLRLDEGARINERMHANAHTNNLKTGNKGG
jgi:hypothetical protein